jgi:predicted nucleic acid-binding protein
MLIYWSKGMPTVVRNIVEHGTRSLSASILSRAEPYYGAHRSQYVDKNIESIKKLTKEMKFISINENIEDLFGKHKANLRKDGNLIEDFDLMIAATALSHNYTLVTNNEQHFKRITELKIENWAE